MPECIKHFLSRIERKKDALDEGYGNKRWKHGKEKKSNQRKTELNNFLRTNIPNKVWSGVL